VEDVEGGDDEAEPKPVPSFMEALGASESMRAFVYAYTTKRDQTSLILKVYFSI
jgi:hypothetical protein